MIKMKKGRIIHIISWVGVLPLLLCMVPADALSAWAEDTACDDSVASSDTDTGVLPPQACSSPLVDVSPPPNPTGSEVSIFESEVPVPEDNTVQPPIIGDEEEPSIGDPEMGAHDLFDDCLVDSDDDTPPEPPINDDEAYHDIIEPEVMDHDLLGDLLPFAEGDMVAGGDCCAGEGVLVIMEEVAQADPALPEMGFSDIQLEVGDVKASGFAGGGAGSIALSVQAKVDGQSFYTNERNGQRDMSSAPSAIDHAGYDAFLLSVFDSLRVSIAQPLPDGSPFDLSAISGDGTIIANGENHGYAVFGGIHVREGTPPGTYDLPILLHYEPVVQHAILATGSTAVRVVLSIEVEAGAQAQQQAPMFVSVPKALPFTTAMLSGEAQLVPRQQTNWGIEIYDGRTSGDGFQLYASISQPLTSAEGDTLEEALTFLDGNNLAVLGPTPVRIAQGSTTDAQSQYTVSWSGNQGLLIHLKAFEGRPGVQYTTDITFTLADGP